MVDRRQFLKTAALGAGAAATDPRSLLAGRQIDQSPNILVILVDQLRFDAFSHRGNSVVQTPNIDRLAAEGVAMTEATCSSPLCGPSRAALLTGCYSEGCYSHVNCEPDVKGPWLGEVTTVDEMLAEAGYHVEYHGKWHTGLENRECYRGDGRVFGHNITDYHDYLAARYPKPSQDSKHKVDHYTEWPYRYWAIDDMMSQAASKGFKMPHDHEAGVIDIADEDTLTAWTARKTIEFLRNRPQKPFAVTCSILQPHAPLITSPTYANMYKPADMPMPPNVTHSLEENPPIPGAIPADASGLGQFMALYYGLVKEVDVWVGKLLDALEQAGCADNTLVIFTADHGEMLGSHRTFSKKNFYDEAMRVPLIFRYPKTIPAGKRISGAAIGVDVGPTILDYCRVPPLKKCHGRSLRDAIEGRTAPVEYAFGETLFWHCIRSSNWKYVAPLAANPERLFDLRNDPHEMRDLLSDKPLSSRVVKTRDQLQDMLELELKRRARFRAV